MIYNNQGMWQLEAGDLPVPVTATESFRKGERVATDRKFVSCQLDDSGSYEVEILANLSGNIAGLWVVVDTLNNLKLSANLYLPSNAQIKPRFTAGIAGQRFYVA